MFKYFSSLSFLMLLNCSSHPQNKGPYVFARGKQKHIVVAYGPTGSITSRSLNFLIIDEVQAKLSSLAPTSHTLMKATLYREAPAVIHSLNPLMDKQRPLVEELLKRLSKILWIKTGELPSNIKVLESFADGSARVLEWKISNQRINIEVEQL